MAEQEDGTLNQDRADPSFLTTQSLLREIGILKEQLRSEITGEIKVQNARLDAIDRATVVFQSTLTQVPTALQEAISSLQALVDERFRAARDVQDIKFDAVQAQLQERDAKVAETAKDTKTAVDAAFSAAEKGTSKQAEFFKEAAAKSEAATQKAIDQQRELSLTENRALRDICGTLDRRMTVMEGQASGERGAKGDQHSSTTTLIAVIVAVISFVGLLMTLLRPLAVGH
jgi:hypothetical protein